MAVAVVDTGGRLVAFTCANALGEKLMPCGRCRQLLWEHGGADLLVDTPKGVLSMDQVLPQAFGADDPNSTALAATSTSPGTAVAPVTM